MGGQYILGEPTSRGPLFANEVVAIICDTC